MLIGFEYLVDKYKLNISGILHVGAHECEEYTNYKARGINGDRQLWIEAIPEKVYICRLRYPDTHVVQAVVSDVSGTEVNFKVTNNFQSSSILDLKTHLIEHPHIYVRSVFRATTTTIKDIYDTQSIGYNTFNFINLDIQGVELNALKGMGDILNNFNYIYTEVNERELYAGCALLGEIDSFLAEKGFKRVEIEMTVHGWGDAFYMRVIN